MDGFLRFKCRLMTSASWKVGRFRRVRRGHRCLEDLVLCTSAPRRKQLLAIPPSTVPKSPEVDIRTFILSVLNSNAKFFPHMPRLVVQVALVSNFLAREWSVSCINTQSLKR